VDRRTEEQVWLRAHSRCDYCHFPADFAEYPFHIDHIIAQKHGGARTDAGDTARANDIRNTRFMRPRVLYAVLALTGFCCVSCRAPHSPPLTGATNRSTKPAASIRPRSNTPAVVLRLASDYIASLGKMKTEDGWLAEEDFCNSFFLGFTAPGGSVSGGTEAGRRGFLAGQQYRRASPQKIEETMEGFGYTETEADGVWKVSFERSGFFPDRQPNQTWWLSYFGDTQSDIPKHTKIPEKGVPIRVRGYLSPDGRFGHLGGYDHEIFAASISRLDG
jgi:hypothetical protein